MNQKLATILTAMLLPAATVVAQTGKPPSPPPATTGPAASQSAPQGLLEAPTGLPSPKAGLRGGTYEDWAKWYYKVYKIPKARAIRLGGNRVRPNKMMPMVLEIVGEEGNDYLVRNLPPEDPQAAAHGEWIFNEKQEIGEVGKEQYLKGKYLIVNNVTVPPPFIDKVRFEERDKGLPKAGRWQISFDIADMNGDGRPDLVFGPARTATDRVPHIFAQLQDGSWAEAPATWPSKGVKFDYGTVRVADFDGDGNKDIAIACHFSKTYVLYGDGKGNFTRFVTIPESNPQMTSRALTVADVNGDGRPDIATLAEVDINMSDASRLEHGLVNIALNLPSGWKAVAENSFPDQLMGDSLTTADLFGTGRPDLLLTEHAANGMDVIFRNLGDGTAWQAIGSDRQPVYAYILATAAGKLDRFPQPDVVECFEQHNPWVSEPATQACAIYRFHDAQGRPTSEPTPTVLFQEKSNECFYKAIAVGDIDGDGRDDIVVASNTGRVRVFLQGADGQFYEQEHSGMDQPGTDIFDVHIADLYHDGKGEVIFAGSPTGTSGGGIWVYAPVPVGQAGARRAGAKQTP